VTWIFFTYPVSKIANSAHTSTIRTCVTRTAWRNWTGNGRANRQKRERIEVQCIVMIARSCETAVAEMNDYTEAHKKGVQVSTKKQQWFNAWEEELKICTILPPKAKIPWMPINKETNVTILVLVSFNGVDHQEQKSSWCEALEHVYLY